jgi:molybdopterin/thiamine biosynthesis adenylyltransferase
VALYLGSAGVGRITLVDHDVVDLTNLQRQIAHTTARGAAQGGIGRAGHARPSTPTCRSPRCRQRADAAPARRWCPRPRGARLQRQLRHAPGGQCCLRAHGKPLVAGAVIRFDGQITVYDPRDPASPCYACVFPPDAQFEEVQCSTMGVFAPLVGVVGAMQAAEALKLCAGAGPRWPGAC